MSDAVIKSGTRGQEHVQNKDSRTSQLLTAVNMLPQDPVIRRDYVKAWKFLTDPKYTKIYAAISGGKDSDCVAWITMDILKRSGLSKDRVTFVNYDTGLDFEANRRHLTEMEELYGIKIRRLKAEKTIPEVCRHIGQPFMNKMASDYISRLQKAGFGWEDDDYIMLLKRYCRQADRLKAYELNEKRRLTGLDSIDKWVFYEGSWYKGCVSAIKWWKNMNDTDMCNINNNRYLKEFMMDNPPWFSISEKCCEYAKKKVGKRMAEEEGYDLAVLGLRRAEGGKRSLSIKNCFTASDAGCDCYRPIFWYSNNTRDLLTEQMKIPVSDCYTVYGMKRTGCPGCPYGDIQKETALIRQYEPRLYKAVNNIFKDSYKYTRMYEMYRDWIKLVGRDGSENAAQNTDPVNDFCENRQMTIWDYI